MEPINNPNLSYLFNRYYYKDIDFSKPKKDAVNAQVLEDRNEDIFRYAEPDADSYEFPAAVNNELTTFKLKTNYPGLLIGAGYGHEAGLEGELKLGFYFDYTSGLPVIPGSAVKGILRHCFTQPEILDAISPGVEYAGRGEELAREIFGNEGKSSYKCDVFYDAPVVKIAHNNTATGVGSLDAKRLLGWDFITPHFKDPLADPTPLQFLKVLPEVVFEFRFKLTANGMRITDKEELFNKALQLWGVGAKTSVGYGRLLPYFNIGDKTIATQTAENKAAIGQGQRDNRPRNEGWQGFKKEGHGVKTKYELIAEKAAANDKQSSAINYPKDDGTWIKPEEIKREMELVGTVLEFGSGSATVYFHIAGASPEVCKKKVNGKLKEREVVKRKVSDVSYKNGKLYFEVRKT